MNEAVANGAKTRDYSLLILLNVKETQIDAWHILGMRAYAFSSACAGRQPRNKRQLDRLNTS